MTDEQISVERRKIRELREDAAELSRMADYNWYAASRARLLTTQANILERELARKVSPPPSASGPDA